MGVRDRVVLEKQHVTYSYHLHQLRCLCWKDWLLPLGSKHEGMHTVPLLPPRQDYSLLSFPLSYKPQEVGCPPRPPTAPHAALPLSALAPVLGT